jgi:hypothetical protein
VFFVPPGVVTVTSTPGSASDDTLVASTDVNSGTCRTPFGALTTGMIAPERN